MSKSLKELNKQVRSVNESKLNDDVLEYIEMSRKKKMSDKDLRKSLKKAFHLGNDDIDLALELTA